jgi:hypothetical protein
MVDSGASCNVRARIGALHRASATGGKMWRNSGRLLQITLRIHKVTCTGVVSSFDAE